MFCTCPFIFPWNMFCFPYCSWVKESGSAPQNHPILAGQLSTNSAFTKQTPVCVPLPLPLPPNSFYMGMLKLSWPSVPLRTLSASSSSKDTRVSFVGMLLPSGQLASNEKPPSAPTVPPPAGALGAASQHCSNAAFSPRWGKSPPLRLALCVNFPTGGLVLSISLQTPLFHNFKMLPKGKVEGHIIQPTDASTILKT